MSEVPSNHSLAHSTTPTLITGLREPQPSEWPCGTFWCLATEQVWESAWVGQQQELSVDRWLGVWWVHCEQDPYAPLMWVLSLSSALQSPGMPVLNITWVALWNLMVLLHQKKKNFSFFLMVVWPHLPKDLCLVLAIPL